MDINGSAGTGGGSEVPGVDVTGVVAPLVMADRVLGGEPGSIARVATIAAIPTSAAIPIPFCRRRTATRNLSVSGRLLVPWAGSAVTRRPVPLH